MGMPAAGVSPLRSPPNRIFAALKVPDLFGSITTLALKYFPISSDLIVLGHHLCR